MARRKNILDDSELAILEKETKSYLQLFKEAIELFIKDCELRNLRPHTIQYLLKDRKTIIANFTKEQLKKLFRQPDLKTFTGIRDYRIMMLMLETGIRINELAGLSLNDIRWEDDLNCIRNVKG